MKQTPNERLRLARERTGAKSAAAFAAKHGLTESTYRSAENGTRGLPLRAAKQYAPLLGVTWQWLMEGGEMPDAIPSYENAHRGSVKINQSPRNEGTIGAQPATLGAADLLPVRGMAQGGSDGWSLFNGETIQWIPRPANLIGVPDAYAVYITGGSMEPRYNAGELVHIHPHKPITPGCYVLVQKKPDADGETPLAVVKRLVRRSGSKVLLEQHTPARQFELRADQIVSMHRVVGSSEA